MGRRWCQIGVVALTAVVSVAAVARAAPAADAARVCEAAAAAAERDFGLPEGLLAAIGVVESGQWRPALARMTPWPYAIDVGGDDFFPESASAAIAKVGSLRAEGYQSIDVGCFQINLAQHPDAFASLDEAFDPPGNARYAARFLLELKARLGTWDSAVAAYHSGFSVLGEPYRQRVYFTWKGGADGVGMVARDAADTARIPSPRGAPPPMLIRVIVPTAFDARLDRAEQAVRPAIQPVAARAVIRLSRARLPVVITPSGRL